MRVTVHTTPRYRVMDNAYRLQPPGVHSHVQNKPS